MGRKEFKKIMDDSFITPLVAAPQSEKAKYLQTVYQFRRTKYNILTILHCGMYEEINAGILNNIFTTLKWKYPDTTKEETENILKSII